MYCKSLAEPFSSNKEWTNRKEENDQERGLGKHTNQGNRADHEALNTTNWGRKLYLRMIDGCERIGRQVGI